jgi:hypothetical protein
VGGSLVNYVSHYHLKLRFSINSNCYFFRIGMEVYRTIVGRCISSFVHRVGAKCPH